MSNNLPPPPPPWHDKPEAGDDLASQQRERILRSEGAASQSYRGSTDATKLDGDARRILKKKGISTDPFPNPDQLIVLFLRQHDVDARPPVGTKTGDAISGAFFGAVGPAASFAGSHLRQQERIAAIQEWTSWKQWALGHADWPAFKERIKHDYDANMEVVNDAVASSWFRSEYEKYQIQKNKNMADSTRVGIIGGAFACAFFLICFGLIILLERVSEKRTIPYPESPNPGFYNRQ